MDLPRLEIPTSGGPWRARPTPSLGRQACLGGIMHLDRYGSSSRDCNCCCRLSRCRGGSGGTTGGSHHEPPWYYACANSCASQVHEDSLEEVDETRKLPIASGIHFVAVAKRAGLFGWVITAQEITMIDDNGQKIVSRW
ncbi:unnamed protein product [Penicillium camemberti]|uniref:Str. FM013 n=1 Tax=Penicillium camemberti (strain FM 013) TaxID=1429867 RepID=A0A0G4PKH4_PENC3|nr:unnamed protein product [Penicillium camemberti]